MTQRIWDGFLSDQDRRHLAMLPPVTPFGFGRSPAVLSIDNYRQVLGDQPEELLAAIKREPNSVGMSGWNALPRIARLLESARDARIPVVHVTGLPEDESGVAGWWARRTAKGFPPDTEARQRQFDIVPEVAPIPGEAVLRKTAPSAFFGTPLIAHLISLGVDTLLIAGESTSGCIRATVVDACTHRFRVVVVEDCVYDRHEAAHAINLFDMHQKYADVLPLDEVLTWLHQADIAPTTPTRSHSAASHHAEGPTAGPTRTTTQASAPTAKDKER